MKIDKKLTTMAFAAAFITSAASAQYQTVGGDTIAGEITGGDNTTNTLVEDINAALATAEANANTYTDGRETAITTAYQAYADTAEADAVTAANNYADGLAVNYDAAGSAAAAEANANTYTDGREAAITTAYQAYADTAEADAVTAANTYADGLAVNYDAAGSAATAEANANTYADGLAVNYDAAGSAAAAEANANTYTDGREAAITTAYQAYADTAEADAVTAANTYADGLAVNYDAAGSAAAAEANANTYTDGREVAITTAYQTYADTAEADANAYADGREAAVRSDLRTSWTDSSAAVSAVGAADLSEVEAQITNLDTYIANEQQYQATLSGANVANDIQIGLDQANLDSAATSATSAATALTDATAALATAQTALDNEILGTPEYTAAEQARDDAQLAVDAATTLDANAQTALTQAQASFDASTARKTAIEGASARSETRVTEAEAAKVTIQAAIDAKNDSFDGINTALAQYGEGIFGADGVNNLDGIIATLDAVVADDDGINDAVDPATLPVADTGADLTTDYLIDTNNDPITVDDYIEEANAALASITAPVTAAEQAALLDTIGNGAFERQAITEIATNGIDGIVTRAGDGSIHIGENSLITNEVSGVQQLYAQDAGANPIDIDVTNGSNLLIDGEAVATQVYADTAEADAVTAANTYTDGRETAITTAYQAYADTAEADAVTAANTYTDGRETAITTAYQAYADTAEADAVTAANTYTDGRETAITTAYQAYADTAEADAVTAANTYTDGRETAITTAYQAYADTAEADAVTAANTYTDGRETAITTAYQAYADTAEADAVTAANTYTDGRETAITTAYQAYADTAEADANTYTDVREAAIRSDFAAADANLQSQIDVNRADIDRNARGIAMVAALTHTTVLPGMTHALDVSAAHFEGETGMAISYSRRIKDGVQINFGAASTTDFDESVVRGGIGWQW